MCSNAYQGVSAIFDLLKFNVCAGFQPGNVMKKSFCKGNQCKGLRHVTATGNCFLDGTPLAPVDMTN